VHLGGVYTVVAVSYFDDLDAQASHVIDRVDTRGKPFRIWIFPAFVGPPAPTAAPLSAEEVADLRARADALVRERSIEARRALVRFHVAKRRAARLQRTPPWADMGAIHQVYVEARRLTLETGIPHHVDHEIPLQGELVSGLHVHTNLQIITGSENSRKKNRFEANHEQ
jgi:hypothetical protein